MTTSIIKEEKSYTTFSISLDIKESDGYVTKAVKQLSTDHPIKGFRPGQASFEVLIKTIPYNTVYETVAREVLTGVLPGFLKKQTIHRLGDPSVEFKQLEKGKEIVFEVTLALWPTIELPDYRNITLENNTPEVTQQELTQALEYLKKARKADTIDDAFAQSLGNFDNLDALKNSIKEGVLLEKTNIAQEKARGELLERIRKESKVAIAPFLIDREAQKIIDHEREQVGQSGMQMEDYLKNINNTEEQFIEHAKEMAEKRLQNALILNEIAKKEHITASKEEIDERLNRILARFSSPEEAQQQLNPSTIMQRLEQQIIEEKVFLNVLDTQIITK